MPVTLFLNNDVNINNYLLLINNEQSYEVCIVIFIDTEEADTTLKEIFGCMLVTM